MSSTRRDFIAQLSAFGLALAGVPRLPLLVRPRFAANPFSLGVGSGDPGPDGVVLWSRLAPDPLNGGGMPPEAVTVRWEVATDQAMRYVVKRGTTVARPDLGHSIHVEVDGLRPSAWYWYRFDVGGESSQTGRTRTAPPADSMPDRYRFAFVSCQHYENGLYTAYDHLAVEDIELVAHLGDYIYEGAANPSAPGIRNHQAWEPTTLDQYRKRYALYKGDPALQAAHAAFPWAVTWDDHEVDNNYGSGFASDRMARDAFLVRRAAAYQAYYEHQPLRKASIPRGPDMLLYRTLGAGRLARFHVLDTRQYRSNQACDDGIKAPCPEWSDPKRVMLGDTQERWLTRGVEQSPSRWNVLAQQIAFSRVPDPARPTFHPMDPWSGYPAARDRLLAWMAEHQQKNLVVLTGDIHAAFVMDVTRDALRPDASPTIATEFIGTSISSGLDGSDRWGQLRNYETTVSNMKYHNARRGYVRCELTPDRWNADYRMVPFVTRPGAPVETAATFVVESGKPGAERA